MADYAGEVDPSRRAALLEQGAELARERRQAMAPLIRLDPQSALREALSSDERAGLPPEILAQTERRAGGRGDFVLLGSVPLPGASNARAALTREVTMNGQSYEGFVYGARSRETTKLNIPLHGVALDGALAVDENPVRLLDAGESRAVVSGGTVARDAVCGVSGETSTWRGTQVLGEYGGQIIPFCCYGHFAALNKRLSALELSSSPGSLAGDAGTVGAGGAPTSSHTKGTKTLLYIRVAFPDDLREPVSAADAAAAMDQVNQYFVAASFNNTAILSTVSPLVVLPQIKQWYGTNGPGALQADARAAASLAGYDYAGYDFDIVRLNSVPGFNWGGLAEVGGRGVWLQSSDVTTTCHELGHNYGLLHANYWNTDQAPLAVAPGQGTPFDTESLAGHSSVIGPGTDAEYGDPFDIMGSGSGHYNVVAKYTLYWLPDTFVAEGPFNSTNRIYAMDGGVLVPGRNYGLKARKDATRNYWVSHRSLFPDSAPEVNGVELHWDGWYQTDGTSEILDTTPGSALGTQDAPIPLGRSFDDPESDLHITLVAKGGAGSDTWADVVVNYGPFPGNLPPSLSLQASAPSVADPTNSVLLTALAADLNGDVLSYFWDFGDGTYGTNASAVSKQWGVPGDYVVRCEVSDMKGGVARAHSTVRVGQPGTLRINGRVIDASGNPVAGARVDNGGVGTNNAAGAGYVWTYTDSDGSYTLSGLAPGNYACGAYLHGYRTAPVNFANPVSLADSSPDNINFLAVPLKLAGVATNSVAVTGSTNDGFFTITSNGDTSQPQVVVFGTGGSALYGVDYQLLAPVYSPTTPPPWSNGPVQTLSLTNVGLNSGFGTLVTNIVKFGEAVIPAGTNSVQLIVHPAAAGSKSTAGFDPLTVSVDLAYPLQELAFVTDTNVTTSPYVPGWEILLNNLFQPTVFQTYPDYNLAPGREEAVMLLLPGQPPGPPTVSLITLDDTASEGSAGGGVIGVLRYGDSSQSLVVQYSTGGTAVPGVDYAPLSGTVVIPAGQDSALIAIQPIQNLYVQTDPAVVVTLLPAAGYGVGQSAATVTILENNPAAVALDAPLPVAIAGVANALVTVTRYGASTNALTVKYLVGGTASNGVDYAPLPGSLVIPAGSASASFNVTALTNPAPAGNLSVLITLSSSTTYEVQAPNEVAVTIQDPLLPVVTVTASTNRVVQPSTPVLLTFTRSGPVNPALVVSFQSSGTALQGFDYTPIGSSVLIPAGMASATVTVTPDGTFFSEGDRVLYVQIAADPSYNPGSPSVAEVDFEAANPNSLPSVTFALPAGANPASVTNPVIAVECSSSPSALTPVTVSFAAIGGSAAQGVDFLLATNSITFTNGGSLLQDLPVEILPNPTNTGDRTIVFKLLDPLPLGTDVVVTNTLFTTNNSVVSTNTTVATNVVPVFPPTNSYVIDPLFVYTIQDDYHGTVSVAATQPVASYAQGLTGSFTIARSGRSDIPVTVGFQVSGTAVGGISYAPITSSVVLPAGTNVVTIPVLPLNNPSLDLPQTVVLTLLNAPGAQIGDSSSATVQVLNDNGTLQFAASSYYAAETDPQALAAVERTGDTNSSVSVDFFVSNGTARSGVNYTATNGTLVFAPGQSIQYVTIRPIHDFRVTGNLTVNLRLANPTGGAPLAGQSSAILYIQDVDSAITFLQTNYLAAENAGSALVSVVRMGSATNKATVDYATSNGTAVAGLDFSNAAGTLFFDTGVVTQAFVLPIIDHAGTPGDQTVNLSLMNAAGGVVPGGVTNAVLTILSDNSRLQFDSPAYSVNEYATNVVVNVRRVGGTVNPVQVNFVTLNGTARAGSKYVATNGTLAFLGDSYLPSTNGGGLQRVQGDTLQSIVIPVLEDNTGDGNQTFNVVLSNPQGPPGSIPGLTLPGNPTNTVVTILDDKIPGGPVIGFDPGAGPDGNVNAAAPQPDGRVLIGGDFGLVDGIIFNHVARLTAAGAVDSSFNPGLGADQTVAALRLQADGKILVGGTFATFNGHAVAGLVRLNVDGSVDTNFFTGVVGGSVRALALQADAKILAGGDFGLVRLNPDGSRDLGFVRGASGGGSVLALAVQPDGRILAGGSFNSYNGVSSPGLARLNAADGSIDGTLSGWAGTDFQVNAITLQSSGRIVIGGAFAEVNGVHTGPLARLNADGSLDQTFADGAGPDNAVLALDDYQDEILVAGRFANFGGEPCGRFLRLNPDGSPDPVFATEAGADAAVLSSSFEGDGSMVIGGAFSEVNGVPRNRVAHLHGDEYFPNGVIEFSAPQYSVSEGGGSATITALRVGGTNGSATIQFATMDGSAMAGVDYLPTNGVLTFPPGVDSASFTVPVLANPAATNTLSLQLALQSPGGAGLGFVETTSLDILDDKPAFLFANAGYQAAEDAGSITLGVVRRGDSSGSASLGFATQDGTARAGVNYVAGQGVVSFGPGQTNGTITIALLDQNLVNSTNVFSVILSNPPPGYTLADPSTAIVSEVGVGGSPRFLLTVNPSFGGTVSASTGLYPSNSVQILSAAPFPGFAFTGWQGTIGSTNNPLVLRLNQNYTLTADFQITRYTDGFESGDFGALPWRFSGNAPWVVETNVVSSGRFAARSGVIGDSQSSVLSLDAATAAGTAAFDYKVSSETNWDWLEFSLNGVMLAEWSGESGWSTYEFGVPAGTNHFAWAYVKDPTITVGMDAGFIDNLFLPLAVAPATGQPFLTISHPAAGTYHLVLNGAQSGTYLLQVSTDLRAWQTLSTNLLGSGSASYDDTPPANTPTRFYRAVSSP